MTERAENIKVTVIVPFHNSGRYIGQCCKSLFGQSLKEVEYIFVDDGSTDRSLSIVKTVLESNPTRKNAVKIIRHEKNTGVAAARAEALCQACGEYIIHCDSDDYIDRDMLEKMYTATDAATDIVAIPFLYEEGDRVKVRGFAKSVFPSLNATPFDTAHFSLCNKLIRRSFITDCRARFFDGIDCWEDLGFITQIFLHHPVIKILNEPMYHYRRGQSDSLTTANMQRVLADHLRMAREIDNFMTTPQKIEFATFLRTLKFCAKIKYARKGTFDIIRWKNTFSEINGNIWSLKQIPLLYRLCFIVAAKLPAPVAKILNKIFA